MTKKEVNEIKSLFDTIQDCGIARLAGCYVNGEKEKALTFSEPFYNLPDEEKYKYLEIFRKTLSGTPGKNLLDMHFEDAGEIATKEPGKLETGIEETGNPGKTGAEGTGEFGGTFTGETAISDKIENKKDIELNTGRTLLNRLRASELKDDSLLERFYDHVIETYNYVGNYLILMIYQAYDVPGVTTDGIEMDDASDEVYSYVLCSICPMKLTKPGLGFDADLGEIHTLRQSFAVELPDIGFLFPAFNGRSTDDQALLYSSRKTDMLQEAFLEKVLHVSVTLPAKQQKEGFTEFVSTVLGDESSFETVLALQENLKETVENRKQEAAGETVFLDKQTMRNVFEKSGVSGEKLEAFDRKFDEQFDMKRLRERQIEAEIRRVDAEVRREDAEVNSAATEMSGTANDGTENEMPGSSGAKNNAQENRGTERNQAYVPSFKVEEKLFADNVAPLRNFEVRNKNMVLRVSSRHTDIIDTRMIDGKKCLVIELTDDMTVNGIPVEGGA